LSRADNEVKKESTVCTGQNEIDKRLGGGIPMGSLVLLEGQSDSGKSVLVQQMTWASLQENLRILFYTTENTVRSLDKQMDSLGLNITDYILLGWVKIFHIKSTTSTHSNAFSTIVKGIEAHPEYKVAVVDALTPFIAHSSTEDVIRYFEICKSLCDTGRTILNVAHTYAFDEQLLIRIGSVCDAHLRLRIEEVGEKLIKVLEVAKIRGADKNTGNIISFDVEPGLGLKVLPMGRAKA